MKTLLRTQGTLCLAEVPTPECRNGEVLVKVSASGICRTDVYVAYGKLSSKEPVVLGHEFSGSVMSCGAGVNGLREGDI